nr:MAG TPA: hypothetical protein [Caudoviricetes sp.]
MRTFSGVGPGNFHKSLKPAQILGFQGLRRSQRTGPGRPGKVSRSAYKQHMQNLPPFP